MEVHRYRRWICLIHNGEIDHRSLRRRLAKKCDFGETDSDTATFAAYIFHKALDVKGDLDIVFKDMAREIQMRYTRSSVEISAQSASLGKSESW